MVVSGVQLALAKELSSELSDAPTTDVSPFSVEKCLDKTRTGFVHRWVKKEPVKVKISFLKKDVIGKSKDGEFLLQTGLKGVVIQKFFRANVAEIKPAIPARMMAEFPIKTKECMNKFFWEFHGGKRVVDSDPGVPFKTSGTLVVRALEILEHVHSVGLVHGDLAKGFFWEAPKNPHIVKLRSLESAQFFLDPETGHHAPVTGCFTGQRNVEVCKSRVLDLEALVEIVEKIRGTNTEGNAMFELFYESVREMGFTESFNYDEWIDDFRYMVKH